MHEHTRRTSCRALHPSRQTDNNPTLWVCTCGQRFDCYSSGIRHAASHQTLSGDPHTISESMVCARHEPLNLLDDLSLAWHTPSAPPSTAHSLSSLSSLDGGLVAVWGDWTPEASASPVPSTSPPTGDTPNSLDDGLASEWGRWTPELIQSPDPLGHHPAGLQDISPQVQLYT